MKRFLFLYDRPYLPQVVGGTEFSTNDLCLALRNNGYDVSVLCGLLPNNFFYLKNRLLSRLLRKPFVLDNLLGYPVYRGWCTENNISSFLKVNKFDMIVLKNGIGRNIIDLIRKNNSNILIYLRDTNDKDINLFPSGRNIKYISNSCFTSRHFKEKFSIESKVIPPLLYRERFVFSDKSLPKHITFIGLHPNKGVELAFDVASLLPDEKFKFYESWSLNSTDFESYRQRGLELGNVEVCRKDDNVSNIFNSTKILFFPSLYETWGRVASEAHLFGIPVVARNIGGIPESVGPGGILMDVNAPAEQWASSLKSLLDDEKLYALYSQAALSYSRRSEFQPANVLNDFLNICNFH